MGRRRSPPRTAPSARSPTSPGTATSARPAAPAAGSTSACPRSASGWPRLWARRLPLLLRHRPPLDRCPRRRRRPCRSSRASGSPPPTGGSRAFGDVQSAGDLAGQQLGGPIVSLAATPAGRGYWMVGADGGVFAFGDAPFLGRAGRAAPLAGHPPRADAEREGVLGALRRRRGLRLRRRRLPGPAVPRAGERRRPGGNPERPGLLDRHRRRPGLRLRRRRPPDRHRRVAPGRRRRRARRRNRPAPTVAIAASPDGKGYWLLGRDGGVFSFGVPFHGSVGDRQPYGQAVDLRPTDSGAGYYVAGADGAVFAFGDADRRRERRRRRRCRSSTSPSARPAPGPPRPAPGPGTAGRPGPAPPLPAPPGPPAAASHRRRHRNPPRSEV